MYNVGLILLPILTVNAQNILTDITDFNVYNLTNVLINLLQNHENLRVKELKNKIETINKYIVNKEKLDDLIKNVTKESNLTEINFFNSLNDTENLDGSNKNLYLKLKEKVNRDDILDMLSKGSKSMIKSARKMIGGGLDHDVKELNDVVDKFIAETPTDDHKFQLNESIYWDPQEELEDLKNFHQHDGRRIFKGERTTVRYYPFMASVHVMGRFWCGGVIYWHDLILTSAACLQLMHNNRFFRENPRVLKVRVGSNHSRIGGEMIDALEVYFHPGYDPKSLRNNIAIIRLRRHLFFTYHRLPKIIDISHNEMGIPPTAEVLLLGWGVTKISQKMEYEPIFLQRKFLPVYPNKFCKEIYGDKFITRSMFCAGTLTTGEGACDHDAGGPAILSGKLVGIISFGPTICGFPNAPTVFTLVGAFADWIETVNETMPDYYRDMQRTTTSTMSPVLEMLGNWKLSTRDPTGIEPAEENIAVEIPEGKPRASLMQFRQHDTRDEDVPSSKERGLDLKF